jgi:hypothetical protein
MQAIIKREKNTYLRGLPHGVCGTFEFYTTTGKCVFCARKQAAEQKHRETNHETKNAPSLDIKLALYWATKPLRCAK